jgi:hypothetical protein
MPKSLRVGKKYIMKKTITLSILLIMTFLLNAQMPNTENIRSKLLFPEIQKAINHVNLSPERARLYSSIVSRIKTETKENTSAQTVLDSIVTKKVSGIYSQKDVYYYNNNGLITTFESYTWIGGTFLMGVSKYENTYNSNKKVLVNTVYQWDLISSTWKFTTKTENSYDANNNLATTLDYSWDNTLNVWNKTTKSDFSYNTNNKLTTEIESKWVNLNWINYSKNDYKFNALEKDTLVLGSTWDSTSSSWNISNKTRFIYDSKNNLSDFEFWDWNSGTNTWTGVAKIEMIYDSNNLPVSSVTSVWDSGTSAWKGLSKSTITYYANHLEQYTINYIPNGNSWLEDKRTETIYDGNNNITIENSYDWNSTTNSWDKIEISTYYYSSIMTLNPSVFGSEIVVYPNPVSTELQITGVSENSNISILDISGKTIFTQKYIGKTIDVSSLNEGIYFLQISDITGRVNYKFIKNHSK